MLPESMVNRSPLATAAGNMNRMQRAMNPKLEVAEPKALVTPTPEVNPQFNTMKNQMNPIANNRVFNPGKY